MATSLVAELIQLAAVDGFDVAFLHSGDGDFVPVVQAVGALGKQVYVGVWPGQRVSRDLRAHCFGVVDLGQGVGEFSTGRRRPGPAPSTGNGQALLATLQPTSTAKEVTLEHPWAARSPWPALRPCPRSSATPWPRSARPRPSSPMSAGGTS